MKKTIYIIITIFICIIISSITIFTFHFSHNISESTQYPVENIELDIDNTIHTFDFSSIVDTSILIVPLESSERCLIGEITDIILKNDQIFIVDKMTKSIFVFNIQGELLSKIHRPGRGPGEYLGITACTVIDSTIIIYDHISGKVNRYNTQGTFLDRIPFTGWSSSLFAMGEKLYFVNNWSNSAEGCYRLFTLDLNEQHLEKYMPFSNDINRGWGINRHYAQNKDTVLIYYSACDTIYKVTPQDVSPSYYVDFVKKKLPEKIATGDGKEALITGMEGDYIVGIDVLNQSENFIFIDYSDKQYSYTSIYDKSSKNIITCHYMELAQNGNINLAKFKIDQNMILSYTNVNNFKLLYEHKYSKAQYSNPAFKQKIEHLYQSIKDDSNPILFIYNIKPSAHI